MDRITTDGRHTAAEQFVVAKARMADSDLGNQYSGARCGGLGDSTVDPRGGLRQLTIPPQPDLFVIAQNADIR
jgi:hypothetical protein